MAVKDKPALDLTQVDGVKVEARTPAKVKAGRLAAADGRTEFALSGVDEIMLADGRVLYQCVTQPNGCGRTFASPVAARSHLKLHGGKAALARTQVKLAELETALAEAQREIKNKIRMIERRDAKIASLEADLTHAHAELAALQASAMLEPVQPMTSVEHAAQLADFGNRAAVLHHELARLLEAAGKLAAAGAPDADVLEKARKWDEFEKLMGR